jgi:hypothetical protein
MRRRRISSQGCGQRSWMKEKRSQRRSWRRIDQSVGWNHRHRWNNKRRRRGTQRRHRSAFRYRFGIGVIQRTNILFQLNTMNRSNSESNRYEVVQIEIDVPVVPLEECWHPLNAGTDVMAKAEWPDLVLLVRRLTEKLKQLTWLLLLEATSCKVSLVV